MNSPTLIQFNPLHEEKEANASTDQAILMLYSYVTLDTDKNIF